MTLLDLSIVTIVLFILAVLRFGLPMLVMWLLNQACCRVLHLPQG